MVGLLRIADALGDKMVSLGIIAAVYFSLVLH